MNSSSSSSDEEPEPEINLASLLLSDELSADTMAALRSHLAERVNEEEEAAVTEGAGVSENFGMSQFWVRPALPLASRHTTQPHMPRWLSDAGGCAACSTTRAPRTCWRRRCSR